MTDRPIANVAASVRQRLMNLSQARSADYNAMLAQYAIERFLYRLSKSTLSDRFVLKGAMLFRVWAADLHRPTKDVDLLGFGDATPDAVAAAVRQIVTTAVADDGMRFDPTTVTAAEIREEQKYGGVRVKLLAMLGNARIPMQVDVGFGERRASLIFVFRCRQSRSPRGGPVASVEQVPDQQAVHGVTYLRARIPRTNFHRS